MTDVINVLSVVALIGLGIALVIGVRDTARECLSWQPPQIDIPPGYRILPRQPYDFENEAP